MRNKKQKAEKKNMLVTVLLLIGAICIIFLPLYLTVIIAIKDPTDMRHVLALPKKLRLQNFVDAWNLTCFPRRFLNTVFITAANLVLTLLIHSLVSYILTRYRKKSRFFNLVYYYLISAMFIPFSVLMLPLAVQANRFHIDNIYGIVLLYVLLGLPMNIFLYGGAISANPEALDEAAKIDGATGLQTFFYIIFPILKPMTSTVAILSFMWTWNDFMMPLVMLSDTSQQTLQLAQYVFHSQFSVNYNLAFASYLMVILPLLILYLFCQRWIMDGVVTGSVK